MNRPGVLVVLGWSAFNAILYAVLLVYTTVVYRFLDLLALAVYAGGLALIVAFGVFGSGGRRQEGVPPRHRRATGSASAAMIGAAAFLAGLAAVFSRLLALACLVALVLALVFARAEKPVVGPPPRPVPTVPTGPERAGRGTSRRTRRVIGIMTGAALAVAAARAITAVRARRRSRVNGERDRRRSR